ncbi:hypothetical protein AAVH_10857 [Aphelenchoides avenae]|nr:hypothetical protein AAVH_10857 [Aphelenchus avenae]
MSDASSSDQILIATGSAAIAVISVVLILITLSVVSDCTGSIPKQILALFVVQCGVGLIVLPVATLGIVSVLASTDDAYSLFLDVSGYALVSSISVISTLQLFVSAIRYLERISQATLDALSTNTVTFVIILGAFFVGTNRFLDLLLHDRTFRYSRKYLRWIYSSHWENNTGNVISALLLVLVALYSLSVVRLVGETCFRLLRHRKVEGREVLGHLVSVTLFIIADLAYGFLLVHCHKKAMPSKFLYITVERTFYDGFLQTFVLVIWPQIVMLFTNITMQKALCEHTQQITSKPVTPASQRAAHRRRMPNQFSIDSVASNA